MVALLRCFSLFLVFSAISSPLVLKPPRHSPLLLNPFPRDHRWHTRRLPGSCALFCPNTASIRRLVFDETWGRSFCFSMPGRAGWLACVSRAFRTASLPLTAFMPSLSLASRGRCFGTGSVSRAGLELQRVDVLAL